jgi:hypothetical protein
MAKIYLTGMTAPQTSQSANLRNFAFAGALHKVLVSAGHDVTWEEPSLDVSKDFFNQYDSVLVGVGPVTSLSANRVYGALNLIGLLWGSDKLKLFVDAPGMAQLCSSLKSVDKTPTTLMKEFYSYRKGYKEVVSNVALSARIATAINNLATKEWPQTIYPGLPWKTDDKASQKISVEIPRFNGVCLDSHLINRDAPQGLRFDKWLVDSFADKSIKKLVATLRNQTAPMKWNKGETDDQVYSQMLEASGAIITTNKSEGSWWTYRYAQSLNAGIPIYTEWQETSVLGEPWSHLAHTIEDFTDSEKADLSARQKSEYLKNIPNKQESIKYLESLLNISRVEGK